MQTKNLLVYSLLLMVGRSYSQVPILNSDPLITDKVLYLDFDGQKVIGTGWNNGNLVNAAPSTMNAANIISIWKRVREDYLPFDVNVTTDSVRYNNALPNRRQRVIITPTSSWYGSAGGVSFLGSFAWGGTPGTPNWVFENMVGNNPKSIAEAASHEAGHAFTLRHQSRYTAACVKTEYHPGTGTGVTGWAPIMGVGYSRNVTIWHNGKSSTCTTIQNDHSNSNIGITGPGFLNFKPDDIGNTYPAAKILNLNTLLTLDSGIISQPSDIDAWQFTICNNRYVSFSVKPWALDTVNYSGANLDVRFALYNSSNVLLATDTALSRLHTLVGLNLSAGSYYFTIDGGGSANYPDYGSLGKYFVNIKATNPPQLQNAIVTPTPFCAGVNTTLNYSSNGVPSSWQWIVSGGSTSTFVTQNPTLALNPPGVYTISLLATNPSSLSCITTTTLQVGALPVLTVQNVSSVLCPAKTATLSVSGASTYVWLPGNYGGASQILTPTTTTTYTITGYNGLCSNSIVTTLTVTPVFTVDVVSSSALLCYGNSVTLTASGASNYTFEPGTITSNPAIITPTISTNYTITGENASCLISKQKVVLVNPAIVTDAVVFSPTICAGNTAFFALSSANNYTVNPGGVTNNPAVVAPTITTNYTITASNNPNCSVDTVIQIFVEDCNYVGVSEYNKREEVLIYPNPVKEQLTISMGEACSKMEICNVLGHIVYRSSSENGKELQISTGTWAKGLYFMSITTESGSEIVRKFVVE